MEKKNVNKFQVFLLSLMLVSCQTTSTPKHNAVQVANAAAKKQFQKASELVKSKKTKEGVALLSKLAMTNSDVGLQARILLGDHFRSSNEPAKAFAQYKTVSDYNAGNPYNFDSRIRIAQIYLETQDYKEAHELAETQIETNQYSNEQIAEFLKIKLESNKASENYLAAIGNATALANLTQSLPEHSRWKSEAFQILDQKIKPDELSTVASGSEFGFLRASALLKLAQLTLDRGDSSRARSYLKSAIDLDSVGDVRSQAETILNRMDLSRVVNPRVVGAILPLSGKFQKIGQRALRGIQLALGVYGPNPSHLELAVIDSEGSPDIARRGVERLMQEDQAIAIIGGLLSREAEVISLKAQEYGVPVILLSQKSGLTGVGDSIFKNALTSEMQIRHLVDVAIHQKGLRKFGILFVNNSYGVEFANLFWDEVLAQGGQIRAAQIYDPKETDFRQIVQRLAGTFYIDDRLPEYRLRLADWKKKQGHKIRKNTPKDLLPPIVDVDAIFIPDRPETVGQVAAMLVSNDISQITLLGIDSWNTRQLVERIGKLPLDFLFVDQALSDDATIGQSAFGNTFKSTFGLSPTSIEMTAYESAAILRKYLNGESSRVGLKQKLANMDVFPGAVSDLSLSANREVLRPIVAYTVDEQKIVPFVPKSQR